MINLDNITKKKLKNITNLATNWWLSLHRLLIVGRLDLGNNSIFSIVSHQSNIDKTYLDAKDPYEAKYQLLINKSKDL